MAPLKRKSVSDESPTKRYSPKRQRTETKSVPQEKPKDANANETTKKGQPSPPTTKATSISILANEQPAFPRGGAGLLTPIERKQIQAQATRDALKEHTKSADLFGPSQNFSDESDDEGVPRDAPAGTKKPRKKAAQRHDDLGYGERADAALRIEGLSYKRITSGSLVLGQITSINSRDIAVALPNNLTGYVPLTAISTQLTRKIENLLSQENDQLQDNGDIDQDDDIDLNNYFRVGQFVRAAVTSTEGVSSETTAKTRRHIELSLDPVLSNTGLSSSNVTVGCTIQVSVTSVEDHGLIVDLGFENSEIKGFVPVKELDSTIEISSIRTGTVILCLATAITPNGRTITLSASEKKLGSTSKPHFLNSAPTIDSFLPGTAVEILLSEVSNSGLIGKVMGMLDVTADLVHSGAASIDDNLEKRYQPGSKIKGRLICTFSSSENKKLGFSVLENVLALQKKVPEASEKVSISSVIPVSKVVKVESGLGVYLDLGSGLPKGFAHMSRLSDKKVDTISQTMGPFKNGTVHKGRVLDFNPVDNLFILSLQEKVLNQPFLRVEDVKIGEVVHGTIQKLLIGENGIKGLIVEISDGVTGLVPQLHFSDIALQHPEKKFREGMIVKARIMSTDLTKRHIRLTLKKTLVNSEQKIWVDYALIAVGDSCPGTLVKIGSSGAVVQFYGSVKGFLPVSEMSEAYIKDAAQHFKDGQVVTVNAISVDADAKRLTVSCRDPSVSNQSLAVELAALHPGSLVSGTVFEKSEDDLLLRLENSNVIARLQIDHISDGSVRKRRSALDKIRVGQILQNMLILEVKAEKRMVTLCNRNSLIKASRDGSLLNSFEDLKEAQTLTGFVANITSDGVFVNFAAGISALIPKTQVPVETEAQLDFGLTVLQPVTARVMSIDYKKAVPRFWLTMRELDHKSTSSVESANGVSAAHIAVVDPVDDASKSMEDYSVGNITKARIVSIKDTQINVELAKGVQGRIDVSEIFDSWEEIKDRKRPLQIFNVKQVLPVRILGAHDTRNHRFLPITHRSGKVPVFELTTKASLIERRDLDILTLGKLQVGSSWLAFVNKVAENCLWVNLSPNVRGRIRAIDVSDDLSLAADLEGSFPVGSALRVRITAVDAEKNRLDLSAKTSGSASQITMKDISKGMVLAGRVTRLSERQILVQLTDTIVGAVDLIDMADDYVQSNPAKHEKNDIVRACVVNVDAPNKKISLSLRPSKVLSSSLPVKDPEVTSVDQLSVNDIRRGFISHVAEKGLFVMLGHNVTAFVRVTNLSDLYLKEWKDHFQRDQLVEGKIISVDKETQHVQMSLKASVLKPDYVATLAFTDLKVGDVITGRVDQVKDFGVFIVVDNSSNVRGLCHRSEIAERSIADASKVFAQGDAVKAIVLKIEPEKHQISFGLKASYFVDGEEDDDDDVSEDFEEEGSAGGALLDDDSEAESQTSGFEVSDQDEMSVDETSAGVALQGADSGSTSSDDIEMVDAKQTRSSTVQALSVGGFDWAGGATNGISKQASDMSDTEDERTTKKLKKRKRAEIQVDRTGDLDLHGPQSVGDYERLLLGEPDSSLLWLQYMAFHLELGEVDQARQIGERALKTIGLGQDVEKMNVWVALLNLENAYGDEESMEVIFKRACQYNDQQEVHTRLTSIYIQSGKLDKADELFQAMLKKFAQDPKIWINYATFLFDTASSPEKARQLLQPALNALPDFTLVDITSKFAQLEFRSASGVAERGRTLFEGLLDSYPKRKDLWNVLLDMETKLGEKEQVRRLFERIFSGKINKKQARFFFKRWLAFEEKEGDERSVDRVKAKAAEFVKNGGAQE